METVEKKTIEANKHIDWGGDMGGKRKAVLTTFDVEYNEIGATEKKVMAYFRDMIFKHFREIGYEPNYDDYGEKALHALKDNENGGNRWKIFCYLKKNILNPNDAFFGKIPMDLHPIAKKAEDIQNDKKKNPKKT
ncbi:MAG: hypothetical protein KGI50_06425 [Patescibacteria group bacterium]|nr:hypothetical protein [Patescibacteria group bacterium]MDE2439127.1 hypothetical protein [Patescibacteria group bacterium]